MNCQKVDISALEIKVVFTLAILGIENRYANKLEGGAGTAPKCDW